MNERIRSNKPGAPASDALAEQDPFREIFERADIRRAPIDMLNLKRLPKEEGMQKKPAGPARPGEKNDALDGLSADLQRLGVLSKDDAERFFKDVEAARRERELSPKQASPLYVLNRMHEDGLISKDEAGRLYGEIIQAARKKAGLRPDGALNKEAQEWAGAMAGALLAVSKDTALRKGEAGDEAVAEAVSSVLKSPEKMALVDRVAELATAIGADPDEILDKLKKLAKLALIAETLELLSKKKGPAGGDEDTSPLRILGARERPPEILTPAEAAEALSTDDLARAFNLPPGSEASERLDQLLASIQNTPEFRTLAGPSSEVRPETAVLAALAYQKAMDFGVEIGSDLAKAA